MRAATFKIRERIGVFYTLFCRRSSPGFCFAKSTLPPGEGIYSVTRASSMVLPRV